MVYLFYYHLSTGKCLENRIATTSSTEIGPEGPAQRALAPTNHGSLNRSHFDLS